MKKIQDIRVSFSVSPAGKSFRNYKFCLHLLRKQFANKKRSCEKGLFFVSRPGTSATSIPLKKATRCKASEATLRKQAAVRIASKRALGKFYPYIHFICLSSMSWYWCRGRHLRHRMHFYTQLKSISFYYIDIGIMLKLKRKKLQGGWNIENVILQNSHSYTIQTYINKYFYSLNGGWRFGSPLINIRKSSAS